MRWEELTGDQFGEAVEQCSGVCLVPLSVIERHGHHLPLGTDTIVGREVVTRAAAREPAIVFPDYVFTQIPEARHRIGTISIDGDLILRLLDNVCREIARNGLKKIVLVNCHGGNASLLPFFNELQLYHPRDYTVYLIQPIELVWNGGLEAPWDPSSDGHAGPGETSMILATRPDLVNMQAVPADGEGASLERLGPLQDAGVRTGIWWYADHPTHYHGDARSAEAETGQRWLESMAEMVARAVRAIKADTETRRLLDEFYAAATDPIR
jgi:creatinine amidohydrolase